MKRITPYSVLMAAALFLPVVSARAQTTHVAYVVPASTEGNQAFDGSVGMEFNVNNRVTVTKLGCFDDNSDGIQTPISVRLYDRDQLTVVASAEFVPGDDGTLTGGSRFKTLTTPLVLPTGFRGTIVAEGYGESERLGNRQPAPWTTDNGTANGAASLAFVGTSRYNFPVVIGAYPETADTGPAAKYAGGTFEFETTPPERPGAPTLAPAAPGNARVDLSWNAVTAPLPAATYRILRSDSPDGTFTQIAEVLGLTYADTAVSNGTLYCYKVVGVATGAVVGLDSNITCARPYTLGADRHIAYNTPWGVAGTQNFDGSLGMDFDVANPVNITQLGCFDDNSDGLFTTISVRLYDRDTQTVKAELTFSPDDSGTPEREDGEAINGMRFKPLATPLNLPLGFRGCIVAEGYNAMERLKNSFGVPANVTWTLHDGGSSIVFTGTSRYNFPVAIGAWPETTDVLPAQYGAGTFIFQTTAPLVPGAPVVTAARQNHAVSLSWNAVTAPLPATLYRVRRGSTSAGPFTQIAETAATTWLDTSLENGAEVCYIVQAVGSGGQVSLDSAVACTTPKPRTGGVAYIVPAALTGNQEFGGALGMEFNVDRPVIVTRLGAFDSGGDGMMREISVRLYNRNTATASANMTFAPGDDGELIDGSRFKTLTTPLALPAGFRGMIVASGYGAGESNGNGATALGLTTFDGACLTFVGRSLFGLDPALMADTEDSGPANRYAAGTFAFDPDLPPTGLTISLNPGGTVRLDWTDSTGILERTVDLTNGPWELVPGTTGIIRPALLPAEFFRLTR